MLRITTILCPNDFSSFGEAALPIACSLARDYKAALILLHVRTEPVTVVGEFGAIPLEPPESDESLKTRMRKCLPANFKGVAECHIQVGDAAEAILQTAEQQQCDLIVLGTHGRSGLGRLLVGSVAEAVLRKAPCPVLTIKPTKTQPTAPETTEAERNLNSSALVTVCSVANPVEADLIRNALRAESIPCFAEGSQQAGLVGTLGIPIKLQVRAGDFDRANKFIKTQEAHRQ